MYLKVSSKYYVACVMYKKSLSSTSSDALALSLTSFSLSCTCVFFFLVSFL